MKNFDEWFLETYGKTWEQKIGPMGISEGMHFILKTIGDYMRYASEVLGRG